jgi:hypothetical protein
VVADADKAMYAAKLEAHADGLSHVRYLDELEDATAAERLAS